MRSLLRLATAGVLSATVAGAAWAQQAASAPPPPAANMPNVGDMAPDFTVRAATRFGQLKDPVHLSDFRGQTVVVWFFFKARTKG
jgi:hypothetical protein